MTLSKLSDTRGLVIDTNLLVLLVVGSVDPRRISSLKRLSDYTNDDFAILKSFVLRFRHPLYTTPNILTEVSNLIGCNNERQRQELRVLHGLVSNMQEIVSKSLETMNDFQNSYLKFGLSDATIHRIAEDNLLVLTEDFDFCYYLQGKGVNAINFENLRFL